MSDARVEVLMPAVSEAMEEGTLLSWLRDDGTTVAAGEAIAEIETDKATTEVEAGAAGVLSHRLAAGATVAVGTPIAVIGGAHEPAADGAGANGSAAATPPARRRGGPSASPLARRIAAERGIDLAGIEGSGPGGRIVRADVEAEARATTTAPAAPEPPESAKGRPEVVELSRLQQVVARRMAEAKATVPEFTLQVDVAMDGCLALRSEFKAAGREPVPSLNDMIVKAAALALREHPRANGSYRDGRFELYPRVNVGFAVAGDGSLVVPTVFDADRKSLGTIAKETRALADRARSGEITASELAGGTFTVSNLGMFGIGSFTAVINPPQAAILAVGAIRQTDASDSNAAAHATLTLTCDHRILYGADAAQFLGRIRDVLERPAAAFAA